MLRRFCVSLAACALPLFFVETAFASSDIVLTSAHVVDVHGHWSRAADPTAAGGVFLDSTESGWANTAGPAPAPAHYVDFTFTPQTNTPYRVWLRLRASNGSKFNDSVFVQFSNARDTRNVARYRIGTTEGLVVNRQTCNGCAQQGWGWYDGAYWLTQVTVLQFATGSQTLRVQTREDGVAIDQIVLSPITFMSLAPGTQENDATVLVASPATWSTPISGSAMLMPGTIPADGFDEGGAGVAYHDTTLGNAGGSGRATNVDLIALARGGYAVNNIDAGEWLNYRITVPHTADYVLEAEIASTATGGRFHVDVNGEASSGVLEIPNTGGATSFATIRRTVRLDAGTHTLKVVFDTKVGSGAFAGLRLIRPRSPFTATGHPLPGTVPAHQFDNGGQGLSWLDSTPGNSGGQARPGDVDIFGSATSGYFVAATVTGEWMEYTVNVAQAGNYVVRFEVAANAAGSRISSSFGSQQTASLAVPNTGSVATWTTVAAPVALQAGEQFMRVHIDEGGVALRSIRVEPAPAFTTFTVPADGNLQTALDAAEPGDVIVLQAGATYVGNFVLRAKTGSDKYITIRSSASDAVLPSEDVRMTPAYAALLPKLRSPNSQPALATAPYASYYRIEFVEFLANHNGAGNIIALGDGGRAQNTLAMVPHHLVLDRVLIRGDVTHGQKRGVALNSADTWITNSHIAEIKAVGQDSQAIGGWNGPGPYVISNNYLEAAGENVMFGGSDPAVPDLVPSDITFTRNHLFKPLSWRGSSWTIKNLFELKSAQRVLIDGNLMENNWLAAQTGYAVLMKSVNQDGAAPWSVVQQITFTNNIVRSVASAINILGRDSRHPALVANNIVIRNNLFSDVSGAKYGGSGRFLQINGGTDIVIDHNTVIADGATPVAADGNPTLRFTFTNNVMRHNLYGIKGTGTASGNATIAAFFPNGTFLGGLYIGAKAPQYPVGNFFPASVDAVPFANWVAGDYRLSPVSIYLRGAEDGTDPGVDFAALAAAMAAGR